MTDLIPLARLWAKTSGRTGKTYLTGRLGTARLLIFENDRAGVRVLQIEVQRDATARALTRVGLLPEGADPDQLAVLDLAEQALNTEEPAQQKSVAGSTPIA